MKAYFYENFHILVTIDTAVHNLKSPRKVGMPIIKLNKINKL